MTTNTPWMLARSYTTTRDSLIGSDASGLNSTQPATPARQHKRLLRVAVTASNGTADVTVPSCTGIAASVGPHLPVVGLPLETDAPPATSHDPTVTKIWDNVWDKPGFRSSGVLMSEPDKPLNRDYVGALGKNRTCDARFRKPTLYPLSYKGLGGEDIGLVPAVLS